MRQGSDSQFKVQGSRSSRSAEELPGQDLLTTEPYPPSSLAPASEKLLFSREKLRILSVTRSASSCALGIEDEGR